MADTQHDDGASTAEVKAESNGAEPYDPVHAGLEFPTEEEFHILRRVTDQIPRSIYLISILASAERFAFYGTSVVFTNFIQQRIAPISYTGAWDKDTQNGAFGLGQRTSTGLTTFYQFWCYMTPLFGAYIADARLGRFTTLWVAVIVAIIGHTILIVPSIPYLIEQRSSFGAFVAALIVLGLSTGLFQASISPFVAEQYRLTKPFVRTMPSGERVIVDPAKTITRIAMYFYLFSDLGALVGRVGMTFSEKWAGYCVSFTLPPVMICLFSIVLITGRKTYERTPPTRSMIGPSLRLFGYASPVTIWRQINNDEFWERAKPSNVIKRTGSKPEWMKFDDNWVDEVRLGICFNQLNNNLISQAAAMVTNGLPNDLLTSLDPLTLIIFIPLFDLLLYPGLRRMGINFTALKRMTLGFFLAAAAMAWAAAVQHDIYKKNRCGNHASTCIGSAFSRDPIVSPISVWLQAGSYILLAFSKIFVSVTGLEYAFTKAPKNMRSLVMSVFLFTSAFSAVLGEVFVSLSADPLLVWNYGTLGVLAAVAGILFWFSFESLDAKEVATGKVWFTSRTVGWTPNKEGRATYRSRLSFSPNVP